MLVAGNYCWPQEMKDRIAMRQFLLGGAAGADPDEGDTPCLGPQPDLCAHSQLRAFEGQTSTCHGLYWGVGQGGRAYGVGKAPGW